ncbi:ABC transporter substrate-binding protein [Natronomonas sp. EA1]|uniref:ABC transporter substrate-binding protein n=1 Tax=Natronomonas sp. EA1 TaxID=3421655 RepID=UPI003EBECBD4
MNHDNKPHTRRAFLQGTAGLAATATLAGCLGGGGGGGGSNSIRVPGLYDISGGTSDVGRPTAVGSRDAITWLNENDELEQTINHPNNDYAYDVAQASQYYDQYTSDSIPPAMIGWGTADTEALSAKVAQDEIVYVSASYSDKLLSEESPYNFFGNLDYTSQARAHLKWIADNDGEATVAFIYSNNAFGKSPVEGGRAYAEELGLNLADDINLPLDANSAQTQLKKAKDADVDYLIHQNTAAPMQVLMNDRQSVYPEVTVCGLTYTVDELRVQQSPETFEGARYVNAFKTFGDALESGKGATVINESFEREGRSKENYEVANLNYVRGVIHALLVMKGIKGAVEAGTDPTKGQNVRQGMFAIDDWDVWGLAEPFTYAEDDRRPTMTGRLYEVTDGSLSFDTTVDLPRRDDWI